MASERIAAQTVLWAAGVAASPVATSLGVPLDRAGRVSAEPTLAVAVTPEHLRRRRHLRTAAGRALASGRGPGGEAGRCARGEERVRAVRGEALQPFHYRDYGNMATIGRGSAVADIGPLKLSGFVAWLIWVLIHIFWLIGFRNRIAVMSEWAWAYVTMQRRVRLITGERLWPGSGV